MKHINLSIFSFLLILTAGCASAPQFGAADSERDAAGLGNGVDIDLGGGPAEGGIFIDSDGDGKIDAVDINEDGVPDGDLVDTDNDGVADAVDLNNDDVPDAKVVDTNKDGVPDGIDTNLDGKADISCKMKVLVCHVPPGNAGNAHTIYVGKPAVAAHLAHGDYLGRCRNTRLIPIKHKCDECSDDHDDDDGESNSD